MKRIAMLLLAAIMLVSMAACGNSNSNTPTTEEETYSEFDWPTSDIANLLPVPKSNIGKISWEASYGFVIYVSETSQADFKDYVKACKESGFVEDYRAGDDYYYGDNENGYHLSLRFEENDVMFIRIDEPDEDESTESLETTEVPETELSEIETTEASEAEIEATESAASNNTGIRPEFREVMDSYEAFIDEYCAFMKKYAESENSASMLSDYLSYMTQYADTMSKLSEIDDGSLSTEELAYYTEVNLRISQKLLEAAQ